MISNQSRYHQHSTSNHNMYQARYKNKHSLMWHSYLRVYEMSSLHYKKKIMKILTLCVFGHWWSPPCENMDMVDWHCSNECIGKSNWHTFEKGRLCAYLSLFDIYILICKFDATIWYISSWYFLYLQATKPNPKAIVLIYDS